MQTFPLSGKWKRWMLLRVALLASTAAIPARAGMTVYELSDVARLRLEDISFFLLLLFLSTCGVKFLWNLIAKDFSRLPRLSFIKALGLTGLISLSMLLVLVMISGAREVLTPEAWRRQGSHYRPNDIGNLEERQQSMQSLRNALLQYASQRQGRFPPHDYVTEIPARLWEAPDSSRTRYLYFAGGSTASSNAVIACEPAHFGDQRFVLFADGAIKSLKPEEIQASLR